MSSSISCDAATARPPVTRRRARLLAVALWLAPGAAIACPKCYGSSSPGVLESYYLSTLMLTLLPFAVVGTIVVLGFRFKRRFSVGPAEPVEPATRLPTRS